MHKFKWLFCIKTKVLNVRNQDFWYTNSNNYKTWYNEENKYVFICRTKLDAQIYIIHIKRTRYAVLGNWKYNITSILEHCSRKPSQITSKTMDSILLRFMFFIRIPCGFLPKKFRGFYGIYSRWKLNINTQTRTHFVQK